VVPRIAPGRLLLRPWAAVRPRAYAVSLLARIAVIAVYTAACWAAANGFGLALPFAAVCAYMPIILLVGALPVNVAGFGAVQVAWLVFDAWAPGEQILAFQFLWRLATAAGLIAYRTHCATCHMPRLKKMTAGKNIIRVDHNQNANLRPNEKMIRPVCMQCHSLEFSIDALADTKLINNNFSGTPAVHIESIDWALKRAQEQ